LPLQPATYTQEERKHMQKAVIPGLLVVSDAFPPCQRDVVFFQVFLDTHSAVPYPPQKK